MTNKKLVYIVVIALLFTGIVIVADVVGEYYIMR
jgi:hypothetical protein